MKTHDVHLRDPFVLTRPEEGRYYLYGTTDPDPWNGPGQGFSAFVSADLENWSGPYPVFSPPAGFWADRQFWAPEVHFHDGAYWMLASFKAEGRRRGVQMLRADAPLGPFLPISDGPVTPGSWDCLDGTLFWDEVSRPWLVFSHEWTQVRDGEICCMPLRPDLREAAGEPITLFQASKSGWSIPDTGSVVRGEGRNYVTDGPFLHRCAKGTLWMLWSSYGCQGYAVGLAKSLSGRITGPWAHEKEPLFAKDGGHGMLFRTLEGELRLALHRPNETPFERPCFLPVEERAERLAALSEILEG